MEKGKSIENLFARYLENECSPGEVHELLRHFGIEKNNDRLRLLIHEYMERAMNEEFSNTAGIEDLVNDTFDKIKESILNQKKEATIHTMPVRKYRWYLVAASVLLVLASVFFLVARKNENQIITTQKNDIRNNDIAPGRNNATLTLENGTTIVLDSAANAPDWYFLNGTNKIGMGYRETDWSLPRDRQVIIERQNIYDGTWNKTPSMGWTFVPLTQYHGGGAAATLEPLSEHLEDYEAHLVQNFGSGVQACYRGPRLFDTPATEALVKKEVDWYKKYRDILNSDIIHLRRADGRDYDAILHVNPKLKEKGLLMIYNPLDTPITRIIKVPLYYTGIKGNAAVSEKEDIKKQYTLDENKNIILQVSIPVNGYNWYLIE